MALDNKITNTDNSIEDIDLAYNSINPYKGYYIVSKKWTSLCEEYITFVRKNNLAYCYNLSWAGPKEVHELEQFKNNENTIIVYHSQISHYLKKVTIGGEECIVLPNTILVRKVVGFDF
jgi:CRISPR/Cas system CMR-associated protein Cmr5 small subunit